MIDMPTEATTPKIIYSISTELQYAEHFPKDVCEVQTDARTHARDRLAKIISTDGLEPHGQRVIRSDNSAITRRSSQMFLFESHLLVFQIIS